MFCSRCGNEIKDDAKFCNKCGAVLKIAASDNTEIINDPRPAQYVSENRERSSVYMRQDIAMNRQAQSSSSVNTPGSGSPKSINQPEKTVEKNKKPVFLLALTAVLLVAVIVLAVIYIVPMLKGGNKNEYQEKIKLGEDYLVNEQYEDAENAFLEAIDLDPSKSEAYIKLASVYKEEGNLKKAIRVLSDAEEKCDEKAIKKQKEKLEQEYKSIKEASSEDSSFLNGEISPLDLEEEKERIKNLGDPTPEPDSDSESEPTKEPTPEPTKVVTEEPTPEPTKEEVTPEPTKEEIQETEIKEVKLSAKDIKAYRSLNCFEGFRMPLSNKRKINERELWGLSEYECKIRYNELYARYGYQFAEKGEMKKHFDSLQWYKDIIKYQKISSDGEAKSQFSDVELYNWQIMYDYRGEKEKDESKKYPHKNDRGWPQTIRTVEFIMDDPDGPNGSGSVTVYLEYTGVNCGYLTILYVDYDNPITYWFEEDEELNGTVYSIDEYGSSPKGSRVKRISYKILPGDDPYVNFRVFSMEMEYNDETMSLGDFRWMEAIR